MSESGSSAWYFGLAVDTWPQLLIAMAISLAAGLLLIHNQCHLTRFIRERHDEYAVQASHVGNPLRLGGVAIFAGLLAGLLAGVREALGAAE